jgi:ABC-type glycerol-3-phosphate transport system substrate-binding protein
MPDYEPVNRNGVEPFTKTVGATTAVVGGTLVKLVADQLVGPVSATTDTGVLGVAAFDAPVSGRVAIWPMPGIVHESINDNGGTLTFGTFVLPGASGHVDGIAATTVAVNSMLGTVIKGGATGVKVQWLGK